MKLRDVVDFLVYGIKTIFFLVWVICVFVVFTFLPIWVVFFGIDSYRLILDDYLPRWLFDTLVLLLLIAILGGVSAAVEHYKVKERLCGILQPKRPKNLTGDMERFIYVFFIIIPMACSVLSVFGSFVLSLPLALFVEWSVVTDYSYELIALAFILLWPSVGFLYYHLAWKKRVPPAEPQPDTGVF